MKNISKKVNTQEAIDDFIDSCEDTSIGDVIRWVADDGRENTNTFEIAKAAAAELAALRERVKQLEWVVKRLEHIGDKHLTDEEFCPICRAVKPSHWEDCELYAALRDNA